MQSNDIYDLIEQIANTPQKKAKKALLVEHKDDPTLMRVISYAMNPLRTFGIGKVEDQIPESELSNSEGNFHPEVWSMLDNLTARILTGNEARATLSVHFGAHHWKTANLLKRIILKDLRAGIGVKTVLEVWPGMFPVPPYMRCGLPKHTKLNEWLWRFGIYSQLKADGMFVNISVTDESVLMTTRPGHIFSNSSKSLTDDLLAIRKYYTSDIQIHGELLVFVDGKPLPREISNGLLNSIADGESELPEGHELRCQIWDCVPLSHIARKGKYSEPYRARFANLSSAVESVRTTAVEMIETRIVYSLEEAYQHYFEMLDSGLEGTVLKKPEAIWKDGDNLDQIKLKLEFNCELKIVGFNPGKGKNEKTFGSLICESFDGLLKVNVSGFEDKLRKQIHENREDWLEGIITVRGNGIQKPSPSNEFYSIFLPRFVERRLDKTEADDLMRIIEQFEEAKKLENLYVNSKA